MATPNKYFTYERRDIDRSTINWAGIGNEISTNIQKIEEKREAQRQEIQKGQLETINKLQNYEQGLNKGVNEFMARSSNNSKQYLHETYKMMKSGMIDPSEYNIAKIKLSDTYKVLNDTVKTFNEKYQTAIEEGSEGSLFLAEEATTLFDFKNRELYINPETHEAYLARVNADGEMDENSIKPVRALANNQNFVWEGFNPEEEISDKLDGLGVWKTKLSDGSMTSSALKNPAYEGWENSTIKSFTTRDRKAGSVLTEGVGGYSYTRDEEEAKSDPTKILMKDNADGVPMPELTEEQKTKAEEYLRNQIRAKIGFTEEAAPLPKNNITASESGRRREALYNYDIAIKAAGGDETQAVNALTTIENSNPKISSITPVGTGSNKRFIVKDNDGKTIQTIDAVYDEEGNYDQISTADRIVGLAIGRGDSSDAVVGKNEFIRRNPNFTGSFEPAANKPKNIDQLLEDEEITSGVLSSIDDMDSEEDRALLEYLRTRLVNEDLIPENTRTFYDDELGYSDPTGIKDANGNVIFKFDDNSSVSDKKIQIRQGLMNYTQNKNRPKKRTILQIMNEDNVTREEAVRIFKAQS